MKKLTTLFLSLALLLVLCACGAPNIGCSVQPKIGIHTPVASGMPMIL